ncbi:hypothetical protein CapIbe_012168 [Capra ibex]
MGLSLVGLRHPSTRKKSHRYHWGELRRNKKLWSSTQWPDKPRELAEQLASPEGLRIKGRRDPGRLAAPSECSHLLLQDWAGAWR